jgi:hypothetical protein
MAPHRCQLCAPCITALENAFQALVDPLSDGNNVSFHGGDDYDDIHEVSIAASTHNNYIFTEHTLQSLIDHIDTREMADEQQWSSLAENLTKLIRSLNDKEQSNGQFLNLVCIKLYAIMASNTEAQHADQIYLLTMENMLNHLVQQLDAARCINDDLLTTYHAICDKNMKLRTEIQQLMQTIADITTSSPQLLRWRRQSGDKYNLGAQFVNNY